MHHLCRGGQRGHPEQLPHGPGDRQPQLRVPVSGRTPSAPSRLRDPGGCSTPRCRRWKAWAVRRASLYTRFLPISLCLPHPPPRLSLLHSRGLSCVALSAGRLSGAITKGYEQDVGTRTSFYGFTAFSITQTLLALGGRGFRHVPLGKVSKEDPACPHAESEWGSTRGEREPSVPCLESG